MKKLFDQMITHLEQGENVVLCSILASSGSTPRGAGAKMAVFEDGSICGTIGGGNVEYLTMEKAMEVHKTHETVSEAFILRPNQVRDIGMICGGDVNVYFQFFSADDREALEVLRHIRSLLGLNQNTWLILEMDDHAVLEMGTYDENSGLYHIKNIPLETIRPMLRSRAMLSLGQTRLYVEPLSQCGMVYIFGGGHVGQALCPVLAKVGFRVTMVENRPKFADPAFFPGAEQVVLDDYSDIRKTLPIGKDDYVVIMTPGHAFDRVVLDQALWTDACYIGVIGSRGKIAKTNEILLSQGHTEDDLKRITAPIGLSIQAETPDEIAISIAGQLIRKRAERGHME